MPGDRTTANLHPHCHLNPPSPSLLSIDIVETGLSFAGVEDEACR